MDALKNILNRISQGWKSLSSGRKLGIIVLSSGIIVSLVFFLVSMSQTKYATLFTGMSSEDMAKIVEQFKQDKVDYKLDGGSILVPEDKVEELRLSVASSGFLPSSGKGFELFDQSSFGRTDTETQILYQRALEGELARTIKGFDQVESAVVHLVMPDESLFVRNNEPARASVTLKLKNNKQLSSENVRTIVALVSASVKNLPKENVVVVDSNYNYLSENLFNDDMTSVASAANRQDMVKQFEFKIQENVRKMLEAVYGPDKARVTVSADLDFDSKEISTIKYDPEKVVKSQNIIRENMAQDNTDTSGSPIDNQMSNTTPDVQGGENSWRYEETTEYNVGQTEERTIKAPGEVKKMSVSVVVDGTLSDAAKLSVTNMVAAAIGYDEARGDVINVEGIRFDNSAQKKIEEDLKAMEAQRVSEERKQNLITYIGYPAAAIVLLILLIILISRIKSSFSRAAVSGGNVDVVVSEPVTVNQVIKNPVILDENEETYDLTSEIKKYATKKPEQVAEIVKSWLAEDER